VKAQIEPDQPQRHDRSRWRWCWRSIICRSRRQARGWWPSCRAQDSSSPAACKKNPAHPGQLTQQTDNQLRTAIGTARQQRHQQRAGNLAQVRVPAAPDAAQVTLPPLWRKPRAWSLALSFGLVNDTAD
jgi:hypothetical protein